MTIVNLEKLSEWDKRPKEYITNSTDKKTRLFLNACSNKKALVIEYPSHGTYSRRAIRPKKVFKDYLTGKTYAEAFCELRDDVRVFDLKKVTLPVNGLVKDESTTQIKKPAIPCKFEEFEMENDNGVYIDSVEATCGKCRHQTQSYGIYEESRKRCLALMKKECPLKEKIGTSTLNNKTDLVLLYTYT